jgi:tetratricopeptide (TPR) repeat protein
MQALTIPSNAPAPAASPAGAGHVALGVAAQQARDPQAALAHYEAALAEDAGDYEAHWRASAALISLGLQIPEGAQRPLRDKLYDRAEAHARQAVAAHPQGADGHAVLAQAIGLASLARNDSDRIKRAAQIRTAALRALELQPDHDGALHTLGRWHAAIARVSTFQRFFARNLLGASVFDAASWDQAVSNLERSVEVAPQRIDHRLALAEVYAERGRYADARAQLDVIDTLPVEDVLDPAFKRQAAALRSGAR